MTEPPLSTEQIDSFLNEGYLVIPDFIDQSRIAQLLDETNPSAVLRQQPSGIFVSLQPQTDHTTVVQQILNAEKLGPCVQSLVFDSTVTQIMTQLIGPDITLFEAKVIPKAPHHGAEVPLHQDFSYWLSVAGAPVQVNMLLYLHDTTKENGCLEVAPGSHRSGLRFHRPGPRGSVFNHEIECDTETLPLEGRAGTIILFNSLLLHRSSPNLSPNERRVLTSVYTSSSVGSRKRALICEAAPPSDLQVESTFQIVGKGPHAGQSRTHYQNRELLKIALHFVDAENLLWIETQNCCDTDWTYEFLVARMPNDVELLRFSEEDVSPPANRVAYTQGKPAMTVRNSMPQTDQQIGLAVLSDATYNEVQLVLQGLQDSLVPGSVVVFDKFYGKWWPSNAAKAFSAFLQQKGWGASILCRTEESVAMKLNASAAITTTDLASWKATVQGLAILKVADLEVSDDQAKHKPPAESITRKIKDRIKTSRYGPLARRTQRQIRQIWHNLSYPSRTISNYRYPNSFFPAKQIPRVIGNGPFYTRTPTHERRRALWRIAIENVENESLTWCEFGVGDGESTDFFVTHKPDINCFYAFDSFEGIPEPWSVYSKGQWKCAPYQSIRPDVRTVAGYFADTLSRRETKAQLGEQLGLVHIDCDLYSSTKTVFDEIGDKLLPGTVIIFDEYYSFPDWSQHEVKAFYEWVYTSGVLFEYLIRSDYQVAIKILGVSCEPGFRVSQARKQSPIPGTLISLTEEST